MTRREALALSAATIAGSAAFGRYADAKDVIRIEFTLFSAFYSPLIATIAGGYLEAEGLQPIYTVSAPGRSALASIEAGTADVVQSAPSQAFNALEKGQSPSAVHFAQINGKDGFFLAARKEDAAFSWSKLRGKRVIVTPGVQPTAMFKYACYKSGLDLDEFQIIDAGPPSAMVEAFRRGEGDYIHLQGPGPQQLQHDGVAHIVASLANVVGPCAFSSLAAKREWLSTAQAKAFMRAFRKANAWLISEAADKVANTELPLFKNTNAMVLADTIGAYQKLGNWNSNVEITQTDFDATVDIFLHAGLIHRRYAFDEVVAQPPAN